MAKRLGRGYRRQLELAAHGQLLLELLAAVAIAAGFLLAHRWTGIDQATLIAVCLLLGRLLPYLVSTRQGIQQVRSAVPAFDLCQRYMALEADRPSLSPLPVTRCPACVLLIFLFRFPLSLVSLLFPFLFLAPS